MAGKVRIRSATGTLIFAIVSLVFLGLAGWEGWQIYQYHPLNDMTITLPIARITIYIAVALFSIMIGTFRILAEHYHMVHSPT